MRDKVSGAIAIPKASWGCAPALPNRIRVVFLRALFHMKQSKNCYQRNRSFASGKRGFHPCFCLPACCNCPVALLESTTLIFMMQLCLNWTVSKNAIGIPRVSLFSKPCRKPLAIPLKIVYNKYKFSAQMTQPIFSILQIPCTFETLK